MTMQSLRILRILLTLSSIHCIHGIILPSEQDFINENKKTWIEAETYCLSAYDTHLVSIHDTYTFSEIRAEIHALNKKTQSFWIGLENQNPYNSTPDYQWTDQTAFDFGTMLDGRFPWFDERPEKPDIYTKVRLWGNGGELLWDDTDSNNRYFWICNDNPYMNYSNKISSVAPTQPQTISPQSTPQHTTNVTPSTTHIYDDNHDNSIYFQQQQPFSGITLFWKVAIGIASILCLLCGIIHCIFHVQRVKTTKLQNVEDLNNDEDIMPAAASPQSETVPTPTPKSKSKSAVSCNACKEIIENKQIDASIQSSASRHSSTINMKLPNNVMLKRSVDGTDNNNLHHHKRKQIPMLEFKTTTSNTLPTALAQQSYEHNCHHDVSMTETYPGRSLTNKGRMAPVFEHEKYINYMHYDHHSTNNTNPTNNTSSRYLYDSSHRQESDERFMIDGLPTVMDEETVHIEKLQVIEAVEEEKVSQQQSSNEAEYVYFSAGGSDKYIMDRFSNTTRTKTDSVYSNNTEDETVSLTNTDGMVYNEDLYQQSNKLILIDDIRRIKNRMNNHNHQNDNARSETIIYMDEHDGTFYKSSKKTDILD